MLDLELRGFDLGQVEDVVDEIEQVVAGATKDLHILVLLRRERGLREQLRNPHDRIHRCADFMAHAGQEIRLGPVGAVSQGLRVLQLPLHPLALGHVTRRREDALQRAVPVVEGGRVAGDHGLLAVPGPRGELVVRDLRPAQHLLDPRLGLLHVGEEELEWRADQLVARAPGEQLRFLVDVGDDPARIGRHHRVDVGLDQGAGVELLVTQPLVEQLLLRLGQFASGIVRADQQIADDRLLCVAQRRDRHQRREPAAILAGVGQLVDVLDAARGLEDKGLEAGRDRCAELDAQCLGAHDHFLGIGHLRRRDPVHHLGRRIPQHPLGADVEDLDDPLGVGGDAREAGAVEDRALQGPRLERRALRQPAQADIAHARREVPLATQHHFADRDLDRDQVAVLATAHDLPSEALRSRLIARRVILERILALVLVELRDEQAEVASHHFRGAVAEDALRRRVHGCDQAAAGMEGDDAVGRGIQDRGDQRAAVLQGLLRGVLRGDIAKDQHGTDHRAVEVADRCATVGDVALTPVARHQYRVVGEALDRAMRQGVHDRERGRLPALLADDAHDVTYRVTGSLGPRPPREGFGHAVHEYHARLGVGGHHRVADGVERHREPFLAGRQRAVDPLQLRSRLLLCPEQSLRFEIHAILDLLLRSPMDREPEEQGRDQGRRAGDNEQGQEPAHPRVIRCGVTRQLGVLQRDERAHLGANRVHQGLARAAPYARQCARLIVAASHGNERRHSRQLGSQQRSHGVEVCPRGAADGTPAQCTQATGEAVSYRQVRLQKGLVAGQQEAALAGLGILERRQQLVRLAHDANALCPERGGPLRLREEPEHARHSDRDKEDRSGQRRDDPVGSSHQCPRSRLS